MEHRTKHNEYFIAAFIFSLLSLIGSLFGALNIISLIITYQMINHAKENGLSEHQNKVISNLFEASLLLTLCISILFATIQF